MRVFGLVGRSLGHSFSRTWFEKKFTAESISDAVYKNFELGSIDALPSMLASEPGLKGFNVTIPYKQEIIPFLFQQSAVVRELGACNCVKIDAEGNLHGHNTDVLGFEQSLKKQLRQKPGGAMVLGTGGASQAVQYVLKQWGVPMLLVSRNPSPGGISYAELGREHLEAHSLVVNTTPLGTYPDTGGCPDIPYQFISRNHFLFDLVYNPAVTTFMKEGLRRGAQVSNGYEMLEIQAMESWRIWNEG